MGELLGGRAKTPEARSPDVAARQPRDFVNPDVAARQARPPPQDERRPIASIS